MRLSELTEATTRDAAIRRRRRLQPAGGAGDKLFPPTYPGEGRNNPPPRHVFEMRHIDGHEVRCVLLDSVQSQANRLEEALLAAVAAGHARLPRVVVDFPAAGLNSLPVISSLEAPHRIFDAILRDSLLDGKPFRDSALGIRLRQATPHDATAILEVSPTALLFGAWNSTGEGGGIGAKFARAIVSEIVGIDAVVGTRTGSRIDPLGILNSVEIFQAEDGNWDVTEAKAGKKAKKIRPSEINHGNIKPSVAELGVTCAYAEQTCVITFAGLRRLRFGGTAERDAAGRAYLAALGLLALAEADAQGYALRSRCDLVCDGPAPLELVAFDGTVQTLTLDLAGARALHTAAFDAARDAGFALDPAPVRLMPQEKLLHIIRESQKRALSDEGGEQDAE